MGWIPKLKSLSSQGSMASISASGICIGRDWPEKILVTGDGPKCPSEVSLNLDDHELTEQHGLR